LPELEKLWPKPCSLFAGDDPFQSDDDTNWQTVAILSGLDRRLDVKLWFEFVRDELMNCDKKFESLF
jgi:hypothetical protein